MQCCMSWLCFLTSVHMASVGAEFVLDPDKLAASLHHEIARLPAPVGVPEGWKLVPREPSWEMQIAGRDAILAEDSDLDLSTDDARECYRAMIAAAEGER